MISPFQLFIVSIVFPVFLTLANCSGSSSNQPDDIILNAQLEKISDETYYFPANMEKDADTVYLPLRRWDIIFTGDIKPDPDKPELLAIDRLIPGYFNHLLVYIGKDINGYAYAVELNVKGIENINSKLVVNGGAELLAISKDYGVEPQLSGGYVIDRNYYLVRWAKTFTDEPREKLLFNDDALIQRLKNHLLEKFPYQLEFKLPSLLRLLIDRKVQLVDDGLKDGAGCGDYWSNLFEETAGVCIYKSRMSALELIDYYVNDPAGREAFIPPQWNPLGKESVFIRDLLAMGFYIKEDIPHNFSCSNISESGIVIPAKIYESELLRDIDFKQANQE